MKTEIANYIQRSQSIEWLPLIEEGVETKGLFVKPLRYDENKNRSPSFLIKFEPETQYPYHNHPGGEEIFVLSGQCKIEGEVLSEGDYLYTPPNFKHSVESESGCVLFVVVPEEVEITDRM